MHSAAGRSWKRLKRPSKPIVGSDKAQGIRESTPEASRYQTKAFLWEKVEVLRAGRIPGSFE